LGTLKLRQRDLDAAEQNYRRALSIREAVFGDNNHQTALTQAHLAQVYIARKQDREAEPLLRAALKTQTNPPQPGNMSVGGIESLLGAVLVRQKRYAEAEPLLADACAILGTQPKTYAKRLQEAREGLVEVNRALHR
jgi:Tfp pilus assembly protein PilF